MRSTSKSTSWKSCRQCENGREDSSNCKRRRYALEEYIILMTEIGYPLTTKQLKIEAQAIMKKDGQKNPFTDDKPGWDWLHGFLKWHPWVAKHVPQTISTAHASVTKARIQVWFRNVREYFGKWRGGLAALNDQRCTINMDESKFPLDGKTGQVKVVLAPRGLKNMYQTQHSSQEQITVVSCMIALGANSWSHTYYIRNKGWGTLIIQNSEMPYIQDRKLAGWQESILWIGSPTSTHF